MRLSVQAELKNVRGAMNCATTTRFLLMKGDQLEMVL